MPKLIAYRKEHAAIEILGIPLIGGWLPRIKFVTLPCHHGKIDWEVCEALLAVHGSAEYQNLRVGSPITIVFNETGEERYCEMRSVFTVDWFAHSLVALAL